MNYNEIIDLIDNSDLLERKNIIESLMYKGSSEIKQQLIELALDENTDKNIRYTAIENSNWQNHGQELIDMINETDDINIIGSALEGAKKTYFSPTESKPFKESLINLFRQNRDDVPQVAIIDYFKSEGVPDFDYFLNQVQLKTLPVDLQEYIKAY